MTPEISRLVTLCASALCFASIVAAATSELKLPPETAKLKASKLPGYRIAVQKCGICHSADYINLQPPNMTISQWTVEMVKMQHIYGAPISDNEVKLLGEYLGVTYGNAKAMPIALTPKSSVN